MGSTSAWWSRGFLISTLWSQAVIKLDSEHQQAYPRTTVDTRAIVRVNIAIHSILVMLEFERSLITSHFEQITFQFFMETGSTTTTPTYEFLCLNQFFMLTCPSWYLKPHHWSTSGKGFGGYLRTHANHSTSAVLPTGEVRIWKSRKSRSPFPLVIRHNYLPCKASKPVSFFIGVARLHLDRNDFGGVLSIYMQITPEDPSQEGFSRDNPQAEDALTRYYLCIAVHVAWAIESWLYTSSAKTNHLQYNMKLHQLSD